MSNWFDDFSKGFIKKAIDKLPDEEQNLSLPTPDPVQDDSQDSTQSSDDENSTPIIWNNKHLVVTPGAEFIVELIPQIVTGLPSSAAQPVDPMSNTSTNPDANPALLDQWLADSQDAKKPYSNNDEGTVDPLSQQEEGIDPSIKVHKQAYLNVVAEEESEAGQDSVPIMPGADKSNAYPPCRFCANYIADKAECTQGLDVEKVQAAKSCSWLNSHPGPFGNPSAPSGKKDVETYNSDITAPTETMNSMANLNQDLKNYLKNIWY